MPKYKKPSERSSETITFRATQRDKQLLHHVAEMENTSVTGLILSLTHKRAFELGIQEVPAPPPKKRPGRPKKVKDTTKRPPETGIPSIIPNQILSDVEQDTINTFGGLVLNFRQYFKGRAEGTRREANETIVFLMDESSGEELINKNLPLSELTGDFFKAIREAIKDMEIRFAKKNLHLTYLRMILHWALKQQNIDLHFNPATVLEPFTAKEMANDWQRPSNAPPK